MKDETDTTNAEQTGRLETLSRYLPDEPTEGDSDRDGVFSYAIEVHAFVFGLAVGYAARTHPEAEAVAIGLILATFGVERATGPTARVPDYIRRQVRTELHYFVGGYFAAKYAPEAAADTAEHLSQLI